jgi:signal transduction histidine kinase
MNIKNYLKEKLLFISINIIFFIPLAIFLAYVNLHLVWIFGIFITWFFPIGTFFIIDYTQKSRFYSSIVESVNSLDKKYLLSETIEEPEFLEGRIIYETLKNVEKDMYNHIKNYEDKQVEYREYIEAWIHEIKTPIASTKLIIDNNKNETTKNIEKEITKLEDFVEQVLYYSRSNDTSKDYIVRELNLEIAVRNVIKRNSRDFIYKKIKLTLEEIDSTVYTDIKWIEFIINQILNNAIKYSKKEDAEINIYSERNENNVVLSIEDNGIGIPKEDLRRIFDKGFTGENGRKYGKSTGMGLYICKKLATKLGLGLELTSEENKGTVVNIIFPLGKITLLES